MTRDPLHLILLERKRQDEKWGEQNHDDNQWLKILLEEVLELIKALLPEGAGQEGSAAEEIVEVGAVALAWLESIGRRPIEFAGMTNEITLISGRRFEKIVTELCPECREPLNEGAGMICTNALCLRCGQ